MPLASLCLVFLSASFLFSFVSLYISVKYCSVDYRPPARWTTVFLVACHCIIYVCNLILKCGKINWFVSLDGCKRIAAWFMLSSLTLHVMYRFNILEICLYSLAFSNTRKATICN